MNDYNEEQLDQIRQSLETIAKSSFELDEIKDSLGSIEEHLAEIAELLRVQRDKGLPNLLSATAPSEVVKQAANDTQAQFITVLVLAGSITFGLLAWHAHSLGQVNLATISQNTPTTASIPIPSKVTPQSPETATDVVPVLAPSER